MIIVWVIDKVSTVVSSKNDVCMRTCRRDEFLEGPQGDLMSDEYVIWRMRNADKQGLVQKQGGRKTIREGRNDADPAHQMFGKGNMTPSGGKVYLNKDNSNYVGRH